MYFPFPFRMFISEIVFAYKDIEKILFLTQKLNPFWKNLDFLITSTRCIDIQHNQLY